jgi:hypothetical protein
MHVRSQPHRGLKTQPFTTVPYSDREPDPSHGTSPPAKKDPSFLAIRRTDTRKTSELPFRIQLGGAGQFLNAPSASGLNGCTSWIKSFPEQILCTLPGCLFLRRRGVSFLSIWRYHRLTAEASLSWTHANKWSGILVVTFRGNKKLQEEEIDIPAMNPACRPCEEDIARAGNTTTRDVSPLVLRTTTMQPNAE